MQSPCLLRSTIDVIKDEIEKLDGKMDDKMIVKRGIFKYSSTFDANIDPSEKMQEGTKNEKMGHKSKDIKAPIVKSVDFGPDAVWMALENKCINATFAPYTYDLCFFKYIEQNGVVIGKYNGWGLRDASMISKNVHSLTKNKEDMWLTDMVNDVIDIISPEISTGVSTKKPFNYDSQMYTDGQVCANGIIRSADVVYKCGRDTMIESVIEIDVCNYRLQVSTPLGCTKEMEQRAYDRVNNLSLFGAKYDQLLGGGNDELLAKAWQAGENYTTIPEPVIVSDDSEHEPSLTELHVESIPDIFGNEEVIEL